MSDSNIKEALESVVGYIGEEVNTKLETKQDVFKVSEMDEATSSNVGSTVQYIGTSIPNSYQHNYFYECKAQGTEPETYAWEQVNVQPTSEGDSRIKEEITGIGIKFDENGIRPYISWGIQPFNKMTPDFIKGVADAYYNGEISLAEIQNVWHIGDEMSISLSATDFNAAQTVTMKIVDFNHHTLTNTINGKTKALVTLAFVIKENKNNVGTQAAGWTGSAVRTSLNGVFLDALPAALKDALKTVNKQSDNGSNTAPQVVTTQDKVYIPTAIEFTGGNSIPNPGTDSYGGLKVGSGGTQYELYKTASNLNFGKNVWSVTCVEYPIYTGDRYYHLMEAINTSGSRYGVDRGTSLGIVPHFSI